MKNKILHYNDKPRFFVRAAAICCITVEIQYMILHCSQSQFKCRECTMSDIYHHHRFLYFHLSSLSSSCVPPGLPPISRSPVSESGTARGQRDNHNTAAAAVPTQAVNTAGEHLIIYSSSLNPHCDRIIWQGATSVNLKQPQQLILKIICLLSSFRPRHFCFFLYLAVYILFLMRAKIWI